MRYVMRIAEFSESSNLWTHIALLHSRQEYASFSIVSTIFRPAIAAVDGEWSAWEEVWCFHNLPTPHPSQASKKKNNKGRDRISGKEELSFLPTQKDHDMDGNKQCLGLGLKRLLLLLFPDEWLTELTNSTTRGNNKSLPGRTAQQLT